MVTLVVMTIMTIMTTRIIVDVKMAVMARTV